MALFSRKNETSLLEALRSAPVGAAYAVIDPIYSAERGGSMKQVFFKGWLDENHDPVSGPQPTPVLVREKSIASKIVMIRAKRTLRLEDFS